MFGDKISGKFIKTNLSWFMSGSVIGDVIYFTCIHNLTGSQLSVPHRTKTGKIMKKN